MSRLLFIVVSHHLRVSAEKQFFCVCVLKYSDVFYYLLPFHVYCRKKKIKQLFVFY